MSRSVPAIIRPSLLVWARERSGLPLDDAARKAGVDPSTLREWERGEAQPSIAQLRKLGEAYKRPIAVFFLAEPPKGFDPQREFRRLAGIPLQQESPALRIALRTALFRREAARELHEQLGEPFLGISERVHPEEDVEAVGRRIRNLLGVTWQTQLAWRTPNVALNSWRDAIEQLGILVFQASGVELEEMRGTSIPLGPLPVILINNSDVPHGRTFTLIHEFTHILLTNAGHRTSTMESKGMPEDQILERASNKFAAAALMPRSEFTAEVKREPDALLGDDNALQRLANRIKVSPEAILRRMVSLNMVRANIYKRKREAWQKRPWHGEKQAEGGPRLEVKVISSVGRPFISLLMEGYQRNAVSSSEVSDYLGIQLKYFDRIVQELSLKPPVAPAVRS